VFDGCDMTNVVFRGCDMHSCWFNRCNLNRMRYKKSEFNAQWGPGNINKDSILFLDFDKGNVPIFGVSHSGKTTFVHQIRRLFVKDLNHSFPDAEMTNRKRHVVNYVVNGVYYVLERCREVYESDTEINGRFKVKTSIPIRSSETRIENLTNGIMNEILEIWNDKGIQAFFETTNFDYSRVCNLPHFLNTASLLSKYVSRSYVPTHDDILRVSWETGTERADYVVNVDDSNQDTYCFVDFGGNLKGLWFLALTPRK